MSIILFIVHEFFRKEKTQIRFFHMPIRSVNAFRHVMVPNCLVSPKNLYRFVTE